MEPMNGRNLFAGPTNLSLENELFVDTRSRSNSHTKMEELGLAEITAAAVAVQRLRKHSGAGSFEDAAAGHSATHPPSASNSVKQKREAHHPHARQLMKKTHSFHAQQDPSQEEAESQLGHVANRIGYYLINPALVQLHFVLLSPQSSTVI